jgi:S-adenosylmethionine:tRNA ribosyltransferase-isomerase
MITNFHLPKSSLLLLVAAFIGKEQMENIYQHAIGEKYKFYSYGDGMLLL